MTIEGKIATLANRLADGQEIAVIDVRLREEYVASHPIIATSAPADEFDILLPELVSGLDTEILLVGDAVALADAQAKAARAGYAKVSTLEGDAHSWGAAGWPLFEDINTLPKAFGEFVEHAYGTPSISPAELGDRLARHEAVTVIDCRPEREYVAGHIPGAIHIPGTDLLGAAARLAESAGEFVIHCGGRTRGIIATQILRDVGFPARVSVLENGTFGWELAGYELETGYSRDSVPTTRASLDWAEQAAQGLAARFGIDWAPREALERLHEQQERRSVYLIDLRAEATTRVAGARIVSGGQLIQTVDSHVATQNAPIILIADQSFAAIATASWLVRLGWRRVALARPDDALEVFGPASEKRSTISARPLAARELAAWLADAARERPLILDLSPSHHYVAGHLADARGVRRTDVPAALAGHPHPAPLVLTSTDPRVAIAAWGELPDDWRAGSFVLDGGPGDWRALGLSASIGPSGTFSRTPWLNEHLAARWKSRERELADFVDAELERFAAPDGVATLDEAKQGYLDWEIGLIDRIPADGTLRFRAG